MSCSYGQYGLKSLEQAWLTSRQIEAARKTITNSLKRAGRLWIRVFPDKPITIRPPETTMGGGKGAWTIMFFRYGREGSFLRSTACRPQKAKEALRLASYKFR